MSGDMGTFVKRREAAEKLRKFLCISQFFWQRLETGSIESR